MALPSLASLRRRSRQVETLRQMLADADHLLAVVAKFESDRELTADETNERDALRVRRERIAASLTEAGG